MQHTEKHSGKPIHLLSDDMSQPDLKLFPLGVFKNLKSEYQLLQDIIAFSPASE